MAVTYGFFDSVNGDRKYNADQMSEFYTGIANDGVFQHIDNGLAVSAGTGLTVNVATGRALIQKKWVQNDAVLTKTISAASATYARIDAVVIRFSKSNRNVSIVVKDGTPTASPSAPSMTRNSDVYEMALAYVNVAANATSVTVTDKRSDTTVCGWVSVAQQTSGEVDAMLNAMKTGFDGVSYPTPAAQVIGSDTKLQTEMHETYKWVNYNTLNVSMDSAFSGSTYPNPNYYFSQSTEGLTYKGKVKICYYAKGNNTTNKALLLRVVSDGYLVERYYSWTESTSGYTEIETPFVLDGSGTQFVAIQGIYYDAAGASSFKQWYDNSTNEYITLPSQPDGHATLQCFLSIYEPVFDSYENVLRGKRWAILGDSRSVKEYYWTQKHYFEYISERCKGLLLENHAVAGAKIVNNIYLQPDNIKDDPHIITVYAGVNDYAQDNPTPLGTLADDTSANTFYGKVKFMCIKMLTKFPKAHIVLITPQGQKDFMSGDQSWSDRNEQNELGLTIRDYADAMIDVAGYYGIPVYDNCQHGGYTPKIDELRNLYFTDGLHENKNGNERLSMGLQSFLESILK